MTKAELIKALEKFDDNQEIMILNHFYGGSQEISAPVKLDPNPKLYLITKHDECYSHNCKDMSGTTVIVLSRLVKN